jgi:hypothetical protein
MIDIDNLLATHEAECTSAGCPTCRALAHAEELLFQPELGTQCHFCGGWGTGTCACTEVAQ